MTSLSEFTCQSTGSAPPAFPGAKRFPKLSRIAMVEAHIERAGRTSLERRFYVSSRPLSASAFAEAAPSHWAIETSLHWGPDVTFKEDLSRAQGRPRREKWPWCATSLSISSVKPKTSARSSIAEKSLRGTQNTCANAASLAAQPGLVALEAPAIDDAVPLTR